MAGVATIIDLHPKSLPSFFERQNVEFVQEIPEVNLREVDVLVEILFNG